MRASVDFEVKTDTGTHILGYAWYIHEDDPFDIAWPYHINHVTSELIKAVHA